jgi:sec-independent protein translocase protein TatA
MDMFGLGLPEIVIIFLVVVVFFFGGEKITEVARGLGRFTGEFKKGKDEMEKEINDVKAELNEVKKDVKGK